MTQTFGIPQASRKPWWQVLIESKPVHISFYTGGVGNPPRWHGIYKHNATERGMLDMLHTGVSETKHRTGRFLALDCTRIDHVCPYSKYEHTGLHPPILERILKDKWWPSFLAKFVRAWVHACEHSESELTVVGCCQWGKHRCVGTVTMLRMLTIMMGAPIKPKPVTHMSKECWKRHACGCNWLCPECRAVQGERIPEHIREIVRRDAQHALQAMDART